MEVEGGAGQLPIHTPSHGTRRPIIPKVYTAAIADYLREHESKCRPSPSYLEERQEEVTPHMRAILLNWLTEVTVEFSLKTETFCLAVNYCDRYLSKVSVPRNELQLTGVTCLLIAAKYEEIFPPSIHDFVYITDNTYRREDILKMEMRVLTVLRFSLTAPTVRDFIGLFLTTTGASPQASNLANYLVELSLKDYGMLAVAPSMLAVSIVVLSLLTLRTQAWSDALAAVSRYDTSEISACLTSLHAIHVDASQNELQAAREKYNRTKFDRVSRIRPLAVLPCLT